MKPCRVALLALAAAVAFGNTAADPGVRTGLDVLESAGFAALRGKRVGLVTNQTGVNRLGVHAADLLLRAKDVRLVALFTPEHGFEGKIEHGQKVEDGFYPGTNVPIRSLYGETKRPSAADLNGIDVLIFDIQDVGARFYTYITTLGYCLEEAARHGIEFYVLDRPNPVGGETIEGHVLEDGIRHFTAYYSIPTRHGMTVGEIARWHNEKSGLNALLTVVPVEGWRRRMFWEDTRLPFVPPSPNIPTPLSALLYTGIGAFEATNMAVGRGTPTPFEVFGAPWFDGEEAARRLSALGLPGVSFRPVRFTPTKDRYAGEECSGVAITMRDRVTVRPVDIFVHAACIARDLHPDEFRPRWDEMPFMVGWKGFKKLFTTGAGPNQILKVIRSSAEDFRKERKQFLLYS